MFDTHITTKFKLQKIAFRKEFDKLKYNIRQIKDIFIKIQSSSS